MLKNGVKLFVEALVTFPWHYSVARKKFSHYLPQLKFFSKSLGTNGSKMLFPTVQNKYDRCTDFSKPQLQKLYYDTL